MIRAMGSLVRLLAIAASLVVALSLLLFTIDQTSAGSENQVREIDAQSPAQTPPEAVEAPDPNPQAERVREQAHSKAREAIDDANDVLVSPFSSLASGHGVWPERLVPGVLALLLYGLGGLMLANWLPTKRAETKDWRTAP
jgi:hypothetical protein